MYSKIVVAYDRSEDSEKALHQAIKLAELNQASIHLVHVAKESHKHSPQPATRIPYGTGSIGNEGHAGVPSPVPEEQNGVLIERSEGEAMMRRSERNSPSHGSECALRCYALEIQQKKLWILLL